MKRPAIWIPVCLAWSLLFMPTVANGQPPEHFRPIDQAVEDLDPLATSLRHVPPSFEPNVGQSRLIQMNQHGVILPGQTLPYYRIDKGVIARIDRLDYVAIDTKNKFHLNAAPRRGETFVELIPANTIYELRSIDSILASAQSDSEQQPPPDQVVANLIKSDLKVQLQAKIQTRIGSNKNPARKIRRVMVPLSVRPSYQQPKQMLRLSQSFDTKPTPHTPPPNPPSSISSIKPDDASTR